MQYNVTENYSPIDCIDQKGVNNGNGIMYSIDRGFFPKDGAKLFYIRDEMWIPPDIDPEAVPEWILDMAKGCEVYSRGLANVQPEVIQYSFYDEPPCGYYAITFSFDEASSDPYIFTIMDIMGEYEYAIGWINGMQIVTLEHGEIDFS